MTFYEFTAPQPGQSYNYPTLGFKANDGAILDGTLSDPELTNPPDGNWTVVASGPESGITRYGNPTAGTDYSVPQDGTILQWVAASKAYLPRTPAQVVDGLSTSLNSAYVGRENVGMNERNEISPRALTRRGAVPRIVSLVTGSDEEAAGIVRAGFAAQTVDTTNYKINGRAWSFVSTGAIQNPTVTFTVANAPITITPPQAMCVWVYIPDVSNVNAVVCTVAQDATGTAAIQRGTNTSVDPVKQPLKNGWNFLRFGLAYALTDSGWTGTKVTRFILRLDIPAGATNSITIGHAYLECPPKARMVWVLDRGYKSFVLNGGLARLRANNIPVTWAIDVLRLGTDVGEGAEGVTEADIRQYWQEGDSVSFHSYSGDATNTMTAAQARQDTMQAIKWLQQQGYEGRMWRAAWVQNDSGGNSAAVADLTLMQAMGTPGLPEAACVDAWPPSDPQQIFRWAIVDPSGTSDFVDRTFSRLQRTYGLIVPYTHGIVGPDGSTGAARGVPGNDTTLAEWDYFMTKVEAALAAGWLECTTFETLWYESGGSFSTVGGATQATWVAPDGTVETKHVL